MSVFYNNLLNQEQLDIFRSAMAVRRRCLRVAYAILVATGFFGGHHWYFGNVGRSLLYPLCAFTWISSLIGASNSPAAGQIALTQVFVLAGYLVYLPLLVGDAVTLPRQVHRANRRIVRELLISIFLLSDPTQFIARAPRSRDEPFRYQRSFADQ